MKQKSEIEVSIIIPVYNDVDGLTTTVESFLDQDATAYEVVIVDNNSTDNTRETARELARSNDCVKFFIEDEIQSSYAARNKGIDVASGRIIAFVDADMWVESDYVSRIRDVMSEQYLWYMGCNVEMVQANGVIGRYRKATGFQIGEYIRNHHYTPTGCLVVRRQLFTDVGRFNSNMISSGDLEFGRRVHRAGYEIHYEPNITLYHPTRSTLRGLIARRVRIGRGHEQYKRCDPEQDLVNSIFKPTNYAPPHPIIFHQSLSADSRSLFEFVCWYLLAYILKLSWMKGRWQETLEHKFRS